MEYQTEEEARLELEQSSRATGIGMAVVFAALVIIGVLERIL